MPTTRPSAILFPFVVSIAACSIGCNWNSADQRARDQQTRDEVAKATERAKPAIEDAGRKLGEAAHAAADEARAAAQGVQEGWNNGQRTPLDINSATQPQLLELPGIKPPDARRIIANRPFHDKHELVSKGIIPESKYEPLHDLITAK
jgi:DNA uptake protein ComE-like DNA-binding protein